MNFRAIHTLLVPLLMGVGTMVRANPFSAFVDIQPDAGTTESGADVLSGVLPVANANGQVYSGSQTATSGHVYGLNISSLNASDTVVGAIDWRDRGAGNGSPLTFLGEDFIKNNNGIIRLDFTGLPAGDYSLTSYTLDPSNSQTEAYGVHVRSGFSGASYLNTGATGNAFLSSIPNAGGVTTALMNEHSSTATFTVTGSGSASVLYDSTAATDKEIPLNGFQLVQTLQLKNFAMIDFGATSQRVVAGGVGVGAGADNTSGSVSSVPVVADTGDTFFISSTTLDYRDRGDSTSTGDFALLGEDLVKRNNGQMSFTLSSLPAGTYRATSFHFDPLATQSAAIEIYVTDALQSDALQPVMGNAGGGGGGVNGITDAKMMASSATFEFTTDGGDVVLRFAGTGADLETPINGIRLLQIVPEPSGFSLLLLGSILLWKSRRSLGA